MDEMLFSDRFPWRHLLILGPLFLSGPTILMAPVPFALMALVGQTIYALALLRLLEQGTSVTITPGDGAFFSRDDIGGVSAP